MDDAGHSLLHRPVSRRRLLQAGAGLLAAAALPSGLVTPLTGRAQALRRPGSRPFPQRPAGEPQPDLAPELAPIDHVVIVMMENHSFDGHLGMLPWRVPARAGAVDGFPSLGADGVPDVVQQAPSGAWYRSFPMPNACQQPGQPAQDWTASHQAYDGGAMDGFLRGSGEVAMGYWDDRTLPFYYSLAAHFPVCDRYFASTLCQTYPNRIFLMAATAAGLTRTDTPPPTVTPPNGHIFEVLDHHGISWADYFTDLPTPGLFGAGYVAARMGHNFLCGGTPDGTVALLRTACATGTLPQVVMVESDYQYASEENPQDVQTGQAFVAGVVDALTGVEAVWERTLLVFAYDEHGGYYDHVAPPPAPSPGDGTHPDLPPDQWYGDDYTRYGFRVPCVVVSPWARRGHVSHHVYDHTSVLATIQRRWNLPALTYRDANADHLGHCLVRRGPAPFAVPPVLAAAPAATQADSLRCAETPGAAGPFPGPVPPPR